MRTLVVENTTKIVLCSLDGLGGLPGPGHLALFGFDTQRNPVGRGEAWTHLTRRPFR